MLVVNKTTPNITGLILAGGQSSRMGQDKALIPIAGIPLIQRTCQVALACCDRIYVVTSWGDRYRALLPEGCKILAEPQPTEAKSPGPLFGFRHGLEYIATDWILLLACDLPKLDSTTLQVWANQLSLVPQAAIAYVPKQSKGWEPLCGFYRRSCLPSLTAYIAQGGTSFQQWLNQETVEVLSVSNPQVLFNCNAPEDLAEIT